MKIYACALALLWALATPAAAHELQANRATLVLRDGQHLSISLLVDYPRALHQVLAPQQPFSEFVVAHSSLTPQAFQSQLLLAQRKLQAGIGVSLANGKAAVLTLWQWPDARAVQKLLQQRVMQAVVAPAAHDHEAPLEIRAQTSSAGLRDFAAITLQLPPQLQDVLVVSYQPQQVWIKPGAQQPSISF